MVYLDHAATTPVPKEVADEIYQVLTTQYGNPSSQYTLGRTMKNCVEQWRKTIADALGCNAKECFFTSCGTEGDNWAFEAALWQNRHAGKHVITTSVEHSAIIERCKWLEKQGYEVTYIRPDSHGNITVEQVLNEVREDTALVSIMMVNNELGNIYPISEIAKGLSAKNAKTLLHTDAVQGFMKIPFQAKTLGADMITISGHKVGAPKGIGALYLGPRMKNVKPLLPGGGQEDGLRSGTEATSQIAGFAKAVELRSLHLEETLARMAELKKYAMELFTSIPDCIDISEGTAPHIMALSLVGWPSQNIVTDLSSQDICISAGSACHQGKPSHVVAQLKLPKKVAGGVIRISIGPESTKEDIDACYEALKAHHDNRMPML